MTGIKLGPGMPFCDSLSTLPFMRAQNFGGKQGLSVMIRRNLRDLMLL